MQPLPLLLLSKPQKAGADWCNNDGMLLARAQPADLLSYDAWEVVVSRHDIAGI